MDKYIATKPVRFDRDYRVGEEIPAEVVNPRSARRLVDAGRIAPVTTASNIRTEPQLFGGSLEQSVAFVEDILGIDFDDKEPPDLETRAASCKEIIVEIKNAVQYLKAQDEKQNSTGDGDGGGQHSEDNTGNGTETPAEATETPQNEPQDAEGTNIQDDSQNAQEGAQEGAQEAPETPDDLTCPTCGKKCGNKAALTTHMKTHAAE